MATDKANAPSERRNAPVRQWVRRNGWWLLGLVIVAGVASYLYAGYARRNAAGAHPAGSGTVEAVEIDVSPTVAGRLVSVEVQEGERVEAGQVIARLDATELRAQLVQALGQRDVAANNLQNLREGSRSEQIAAAWANLTAAEAAYAGAQQQLDNAERGFANSVDTRQAVDAAHAQVHALTAQHTAAQRQVEAASAQARGAQETLANAEAALAAVTELRQARDAAQGQLDAARAAQDRADSALATSRSDFERMAALYRQGAIARRDYDNARLARDTAQAGRDTAFAQVRTAEDTLQNATRALDDRLQARQGVITARAASRTSDREREAAEARTRSAAAQLDGARDALTSARIADADRLQVRTARDTALTAVETTRAQVEAARQQYLLLQAGNTRATLQAAEGQLRSAQGAVDLAQKRLSDTVIRAPRRAIVATVIARAGETVSPGLPIVRVLDLANAYVKVYLPFQSFGEVRIGQTATITTDAISHDTFAGVVREVASEAEFTPKNVETRDQRLQQVYWVKVGIDDPDGRLKPGMPAHAIISTAAGDTR